MSGWWTATASAMSWVLSISIPIRRACRSANVRQAPRMRAFFAGARQILQQRVQRLVGLDGAADQAERGAV